MKATAVISLFLIAQLSSNYQTSALLFKIRRTVQNGADSFEIISSLCPHNNDYECGHFSGEAISVTQSCNCSCLMKEATFKPFETQWSCYENKEVRLNLQNQQQRRPNEKACTPGMITMFTDESTNSSLRVLNVGYEKEISLRNNWDKCTLYRDYTWYSGCDDSRRTSGRKLDVMENLFKLERGHQNYILKVKRNVSDTHLLKGLIINLGIHCTNATRTRRGCLLFKMEGTINCHSAKTSKPPLPKVLSTSLDMITSTPITTTISKTDGHTETVTVQPSTPLETSPSPTRQEVTHHSTTLRPRPDDTGRSTGHDSQQNAVWIIISVSVSSMLLVVITAFVVCRRSLSSKKISHMVNVERRESQAPQVIRSLTNTEFPDEEPNGYFSLTFREPSVYTSTYQVPVNRRTSFNEINNPMGQTFEDEHMHDPFPVPQRHNFQSFKYNPQILASFKKQTEPWDRTLGQTFEDEHMHDPLKNVPHRNNLQSFRQNPHIPESVRRHAKNQTIRFIQEHGPLSIEQLVYNIVEEILIGGQEMTDTDEDQDENDPVYQVIEEYCGEPPQDTTQHDNAMNANRDPVYQTLEEGDGSTENQKNPDI